MVLLCDRCGNFGLKGGMDSEHGTVVEYDGISQICSVIGSCMGFGGLSTD
jgi:hypothetical protein